jgi:hypothetical protein
MPRKFEELSAFSQSKGRRWFVICRVWFISVNLAAELARIRIVLAANVVDGYPSEFEYTRDFLLENGIGNLTTISHPLQKRSEGISRFTNYVNGKEARTRSISRPNFPPSTHVIDFATGLLPLKADIWIGFNPIMTAMGALVPRSKVLANWAIDFVPSRGTNGLAENIYRGIEGFMMNRIDVQIENTIAALEARSTLTGRNPKCQIIAPIGVWHDSFSKPQPARHAQRRVVYFGSLDERNGVPFLSEIFPLMLNQDSNLLIDVIGEGEYSSLMVDLTHQFPEQFTYHGYIENQGQIDEILRRSVVAVAPKDESPGSFTQFAEPQKLKYYASNGVPTILTNIAPAAEQMENSRAAVLLSQSDGHSKWVDTIFHWLDDSDDWFAHATNSHNYALNFERKHVYTQTFLTLLNLVTEKYK